VLPSNRSTVSTISGDSPVFSGSMNCGGSDALFSFSSTLVAFAGAGC